jgi:uncharacterized membrane protein YkvA (DUF1232 family)
MYSRLIWALARDSRIPASRKAILVGAVGYVLVGRDLIPDEIPVLGGIDDLAVVVLAVELFFEGVPDEILQEKIEELEIDGDVFRHDMDQVRRVTPAPVRKIIRRLPDALDSAGRFAKQARLGSLIRSWASKSWATKEESFA